MWIFNYTNFSKKFNQFPTFGLGGLYMRSRNFSSLYQ